MGFESKSIRLLAPLAVVSCWSAHAAVPGTDPVEAAGKQRAAASPLQWDVREAVHPSLGFIRFAVLRNPIATAVGEQRVTSRAYLSCERSTGKIAIEIGHGTGPDDPGGLQPRTLPRLTCHRFDSELKKLEQEAIEAQWSVNELGDALARGFRPFTLRECVSIDVTQEVALPSGWREGSARVAWTLTPYAKALDEVFVACGEISAYGPAGTAPPAPVAAARAAPPAAAPAWQEARTSSSGKTNVRARPSLDGAVVTQLAPGAVLQAQKTATDWWRVRGTAGTPFEGYIREDRLVIK